MRTKRKCSVARNDHNFSERRDRSMFCASEPAEKQTCERDPGRNLRSLRSGPRDRDGPGSDADKRKTTTANIPFVDGTSQTVTHILPKLDIRAVQLPRSWKWTIQHRLKDPTDPSLNCPDWCTTRLVKIATERW